MMWDAYRYTDPIAEACTEAFGTRFELYNTGGGCICLHAVFEGGIYVLIGCAVDGPLLRDREREGIPFAGGFGVGVYDDGAAWTGLSRAYAVDYQAENPYEVIDLVKRALDMSAKFDGDSYVQWSRLEDGTVVERRSTY